MGVFDSQVTGGKRYDLALQGRRLAPATYYDPVNVDAELALTYAMDLTPFIKVPNLSIASYVLNFIDQLKTYLEQRLGNVGGSI